VQVNHPYSLPAVIDDRQNRSRLFPISHDLQRPHSLLAGENDGRFGIHNVGNT